MASEENQSDTLAALDFRARCESSGCGQDAWFSIKCKGCWAVGFVCDGCLRQIRLRARRRMIACIHCDNHGDFLERWEVEDL
jgi:hypothetical protein